MAVDRRYHAALRLADRSWYTSEVRMPDFGRYSHLFYLVAFNLVMLAILWARNWRWLLTQRRTLLVVVAAAVLWMFVTDPIGGAWQAWFFDPDKVLGIWLFGRDARRRPARHQPDRPHRCLRGAGLRLQPPPLHLSLIPIRSASP